MSAQILFTLLLLSLPSFAATRVSSQLRPRMASPSSSTLTTSNSNISAATTPQPHRDSWGLGLGLPGLLEGRWKTQFKPGSYLGIGFGYLPATIFISPANKTSSTQFSERFESVIKPNLDIITNSLFVQTNFSKHFFWEAQLNLLIISAGGELFLKDPQTQSSIEVANLNFTLFQSQLSFLTGYRFGSDSFGEFEAVVGLSIPLSTDLVSSTKGNLPAFLNLAPEYKKSFVDGREALEQDITNALKKTNAFSQLWPCLALRWYF